MRTVCFNVTLPRHSPAMPREVESSKTDQGPKCFLLGPCYHLVKHVEIEHKSKEKSEQMGVSEVTEEVIVRDIKTEKVDTMTYISYEI